MGAVTVEQAVMQALGDAREDYEAVGALVVTAFEATHAIDASEPALREALYTIFRGLPARIAPGASLFIGTLDKAGGDVELVWEARERPGMGDPGATHARAALGAGPYGDLFELAVLGLETVCRARSGFIERPSHVASPNVSSGKAVSALAQVMRRYSFVFPGFHDRHGAYER